MQNIFTDHWRNFNQWGTISYVSKGNETAREATTYSMLYRRAHLACTPSDQCVPLGWCCFPQTGISSWKWLVWGSLGWQLHPKLMVSDAFPKAFTYIVHWKCRNCSTMRCSCRSNNLKCTGACACFDGICHNPYSVTDSDHADSD